MAVSETTIESRLTDTDTCLRPTRALIDLQAFRDNVQWVRKRVHPAKIMAMIKCNAYGHGMTAIAGAAVEAGVDAFAVAIADEALALARLDLGLPILMLHPPEEAELPALLEADVILPIVSHASAGRIDAAAASAGKTATVHIKIDTGMGRLGIPWNHAETEIVNIRKLSSLNCEGLYTHFASSDAVHKDHMHLQQDRFNTIITRLRAQGIEFREIHAANSGAVMDHPESYYTMVRPGLLLYGYDPVCRRDSETPVKPVMTFLSKVTQLRHLPSGSTISYGAAYTLQKDGSIASLPVGYGDGYPRCLSGTVEVAVRNQRVPVVGAVCMDWIMIHPDDALHLQEGDDVVLFGHFNGMHVSVWELAQADQTHPYEILCQIHDRVPRIYLHQE